jgi:hypothetical protein
MAIFSVICLATSWLIRALVALLALLGIPAMYAGRFLILRGIACKDIGMDGN